MGLLVLLSLRKRCLIHYQYDMMSPIGLAQCFLQLTARRIEIWFRLLGDRIISSLVHPVLRNRSDRGSLTVTRKLPN